MRLFAAALAVVAVLGAGCAEKGPNPEWAGLSPVQSAPAPPNGVVARSAKVTAIRIPSIGVNGTDVIRVGLDKAGAMQVPPLSNVMQAGYYCPSGLPPNCGWSTPGEPGHPAIVVAHIDGLGKPGLFKHLAELKPGATIEIDKDDQTTAVFTVTKVDVVKKVNFPTNLVYNTVPDPELRVITCGPGPLENTPQGRSYINQTIGYAKLVALKPKAA